MKKHLFLLMLLTSLQCGMAQNIDNLNIEKVQGDGLANNAIVCISQDNNGFLWFGTAEGLFRYDGYSFRAFKNFPGDSTTLPNNIIEALYPEKNNLWVVTREGLCSMDINSLAVKNFPAREFLQLFGVVAKNDSVFWISTTSGLFQF